MLDEAVASASLAAGPSASSGALEVSRTKKQKVDHDTGSSAPAVNFNGSAMDSMDAMWYGDFPTTPRNTEQASVSVLATNRKDNTSATVVSHSSITTRSSRVLGKMNSEQALDIYLHEDLPHPIGNNDNS
jgi:hypothetical protein